jgi:osomolarity two-component system response regulator SSK1
LDTTERGDSIELGLLIDPIPTSSNFSLPETASEGELLASPVDQSGAIRVTIRISHRFATSEVGQNIDLSLTSLDELRPKPYFSTLLFRRVLRKIGANLKSDLPPPDFFSYGRTCEFDLVLDKVATPPVTPLCTRSQKQPIEPTLEQLSFFGETLKGKRVTLYASVKGSFAHHLTSYLTAWGMDVTHVSPGGELDGSTDQSAHYITQNSTSVSIDPSSSLTRAEPRTGSPELIFIDDDVDILKDHLNALRCGNPSNAPRKRPSLQANHRPRSSQQVPRVPSSLRAPTAVVILHFTSLSNYKLVKDVVQSIMALYAAMAVPLPEVMIIPKPAGPRRFLTALHTSITKPTVDPFFIPIATSPVSPGSGSMQIGSTPIVASPISENTSNQASVPGSQGNSAAIALSQTQSPLSKASTRPTGSRTNSERSIKSLEGPGGLATSALPPSPLALPDNVEYFSSTAQKLGNSPSSGVVIQSPDGQTAGIYFHPRSKNVSRHPSTNNIEKEKVQLGPTPSRRPSTSRVVTSHIKEDTMTFSSLYASPQNAIYTPPPPPSDVDVSDVQQPSPSPSGAPLMVPTPVKIITTSLDSQQQQLKPSTPSPSSPRSPSRRAREDSRGIPASPAVGFREGSGSPTKRSSSKKPSTADTTDSKDTASPLKQKGKISATGDANVVPPISVLIVDGMWC